MFIKKRMRYSHPRPNNTLGVTFGARLRSKIAGVRNDRFGDLVVDERRVDIRGVDGSLHRVDAPRTDADGLQA